MPAKNEHVVNFMRMAKAVKHGHRITNISAKTRADLQRAAKSMTNKQLQDFSHVAKRASATKKK